jgi:CHASE3 domain sensor protein
MIRKAALQVGFPVLLVCIALNAYLAVAHLRQMQQMAAVTVNISKTQATISEVVKDLIDMETGQRGYLLTGDQSYLQPYTAAIDRIGTDFANLRSELPSRPGGQQALESRLESLARSKQSEMERTIDLRQKRYRHRSFMLVDTNEGKAYMDEARQIVSSLASAESSALVRFDLEKKLALRKMLSEIIMVNLGVFVLAGFLFRLVRYDGRVKAKEAARSRHELALRDAQLAKLTSALSGQARSGFTALNANSRLLLENYGGFLPRQGHECAEQMKEVATEMERLRQDLVGDQIPGCEPTAA